MTKIWLFISCVAQPLLPPAPHNRVFSPQDCFLPLLG